MMPSKQAWKSFELPNLLRRHFPRRSGNFPTETPFATIFYISQYNIANNRKQHMKTIAHK
jgi:hypothetical protein